MDLGVVSLRPTLSTQHRCVAVFAGKSAGLLSVFEQAASELGEALAQQPVDVLLEGASGGLVRTIATSLLEAGASVIRVGVRGELRGADLSGCERWEVADHLQARRLLLLRAHAVLFLPGGIDCCAAVFDALCFVLANLPRKPIGLLDTAAFYLPMQHLLSHCSANGFLREDAQHSLYVEPRPRRLLERVFKDVGWLMAGDDLRWKADEVRSHG